MKERRAQADERRRGPQARARGDALWAAGDKEGSTRAHQRATAYEEKRRTHEGDQSRPLGRADLLRRPRTEFRFLLSAVTPEDLPGQVLEALAAMPPAVAGSILSFEVIEYHRKGAPSDALPPARSGAGRRLSDVEVREKAHVAFSALRLLLDGGHVPEVIRPDVVRLLESIG